MSTEITHALTADELRCIYAAAFIAAAETDGDQRDAGLLAVARAAAERERAAVVAWLDDRARENDPKAAHNTWTEYGDGKCDALFAASASVERGDHATSDTSGGAM